jgi:hypothetical protein
MGAQRDMISLLERSEDKLVMPEPPRRSSANDARSSDFMQIDR